MPTQYAHYTFLPHLRQGFVDRITTVDTANASVPERAEIELDVKIDTISIAGANGTLGPISQTIKIKGPGDITGINSSIVVKQYPSDWTTNFEPNYLPYIEFYDEDFPWRYTPAKARHESGGDNKFRLRPWISLIVLKEEEFKDLEFNGLVPTIEILGSNYGEMFPKADQTWAWAHVHVNDDLGAITYDANHEIFEVTKPGATSSVPWRNQLTELQNSLIKNPDVAVSRILCPRRLEPNTGYHAFLIPTFEIGRLAGIKGTISPTQNALDPSWSSGSFQKAFPVYSRWFFKTGVGGDFESLVRMLRPRAVGNEAGKRLIDLQLPGNPLFNIDDAPDPNNPTLGLQGVLHPVGQNPDPWPFPTVPPTSQTTNDFVDNLRFVLNNTNAQGIHPDPLIGPPIYGKWHAQEATLKVPSSHSDWLDEVNLDPRYRLFAGAGTEVVRKNQDRYMAIAWTQVGQVIEANRSLRQMQLALQASEAMHEKHLNAMSDELLLNVTAPAHAKVRVNASKTIYKEVEDSIVPNNMLSGAFRRITGRAGALTRTLTAAGLDVSTEKLIDAVNSGASALSASYTAPTGMRAVAVPVSFLSSPASTSIVPGPRFSLLPTRSTFFPTPPGSAMAGPVVGAPTTLTATKFISAVNSLSAIATAFLPAPSSAKPQLIMNTTRSTIDTTIQPSNSILDLAVKQVTRSNPLFATLTPLSTVAPVMAAPKINIPLYRDLVPLSTEWLMPGLNTIPDNSVCLLEMDQSYIEAFMLGANYEMARELLWRGFPTDQRGTYFSHFWEFQSATETVASASNDLDPFRDIYPIEQWRLPRGLSGNRTPLGANSPRFDALNNPADILVLTIRGELFRRYPNVQIYMNLAEWDTSKSVPINHPRLLSSSQGAKLHSVFSAQVSPDIYFLGFPISPATAKGSLNLNDPGYFFVFEEHSTEVKFGADEPKEGITYGALSPGHPDYPGVLVADGTWNDLTWGHLTLDPAFNGQINVDPDSFKISLGAVLNLAKNPDEVNWGRNSATVAYSLLQLPVKLNVHAKELIA